MEAPFEIGSESERLWGFVPLGFSFRPSDFVLISHFLYNKIANKPISCNKMIRDCNLYGSMEPWEIWNSFGGPLLELEHHHHHDHDDQDLYFFTHLKNKGSRFCRRVGSGTWQGEDSAQPILNRQKTIGWRKRFRYEKKSHHQHGCWIMHEYALDSSLLSPHQPNNYVLCRLRKNHRLINKKNKLPESEPETYADVASTSNSQPVISTCQVTRGLNNKKKRKLTEPNPETYADMAASTSNSQAISNSGTHTAGLRRTNKKRKLTKPDADTASSEQQEASKSQTGNEQLLVTDGDDCWSSEQQQASESQTGHEQLLVTFDDDDYWILQQLWSELEQPPSAAASIDALFN